MTSTQPLDGLPVVVDEDGNIADIDGEELANHYLRDLRRQRRELDEIRDRYDVEIERLKAERDDLATAPRNKIEKLERALTLWHEGRLREAIDSGLPEKKWPKSIKLALGTLKSKAGTKKLVPPAEDSDEYVEFYEWVKANASEAITFVPASSRVDIGKLKATVDFDDEKGGPVWTEETRTEDGEFERNSAPGAVVQVSDRTFTVEVAS